MALCVMIALMCLVCFLICHTNIPDENFKKNIILCGIKVLERFFAGDELSEMIDMLRCESEIPEIARIIEKYGPGFEVLYFDMKVEAKLEDARNLLAEGVDEEIISRCTGFSIDQLEEIKRKL